MKPLTSVIRPYAWGSRSAIAEIQGRTAPADGPEAELWIGAHPADPSRVAGTGLDELLAAEPDRLLGPAVVERFGPRLPYLMKILAADAPLSLQAHPTLEHARARFAAGHGGYVDANHKPELLVALTPFDALCGFADPAVAADRLDGLGIAELAGVTAALRTGPGGPREAVRTLLTWPVEGRAGLVKAAVAAGTAPLVAELARFYPEDTGVLVALLLNHVRLEPGQAIWMPAGNLHAYLRGTGIEIMAASDNVLRGGMTPKRVDVDELLEVLRFEPLDEPLHPAAELAEGVRAWPVPVPDFLLHQVVPGARTVTLDVPGPRIVLAVGGAVRADDGQGVVEIAPGTAAFAGADAGPLRLSGPGAAFVAATGV
ncbi:mannose-6-phosphate isomerase, class I [Catenuloplanes atrovinosus]|uniref:mannose-6-phosphate isomerase n=1 Tax=Catenuloplanes atrovinosus TaxID=137266 RepID=A0AAE3YWG2_9ACTN|nr:mannose-6-phosphate isomerase, class I [Catenuloplanes atrovinosus]MDR7279171.1 mannose-6-phosphate isomerase [Catenuloplanes atrovinosus]